MNQAEINAHFNSLYSEFVGRDAWLNKRPLLAHYTTIDTVEKILRSEDIWLSNPLFMNDLEEMRFGLSAGLQIFVDYDLQVHCGLDEQKAEALKAEFIQHYRNFENEHALDIYVVCMSVHQAGDTDGILSMWRAYGGNGNGAALVFNTQALDIQRTSPLLLMKVEYMSSDQRKSWLTEMIANWCKCVKDLEPNSYDPKMVTWHVLNLVVLFALTSKHQGFREEHEARLIYLPERDFEGKLHSCRDYVVTPWGVQPKLKLKIGYVEGVTQKDLSLTNIIESIILGPTASSPLAKASVMRMLEKLEKKDLIGKVRTSSIPLRPLQM